MNLLRLFPVLFSFLLIAAHFQRANLPLLALCCLLAPGLLLVTRKWSVQTIQLLLVLAATEWLRTLVVLMQQRQESGMPYTRLAIILGTVALFTAASALVFRLPALRKKYFRQKP